MTTFLLWNRLPFYKRELVLSMASNSRVVIYIIGHDDGIVRKNFDVSIKETNIILEESFLTFMLKLVLSKQRRLITSGWNHWKILFALICCSRRDRCMIIESFEQRTASRLKGYIRKLMVRMVTTAYLSGTKHDSWILELGFRGKRVLTKGVGTIEYRPSDIDVKREYKGNYIYVGRLERVKGLRELLELFKSCEDIRLTICGDGELRPEITELAEQQDNIIYKGFIENSEIPEFIAESDFLILYSSWEPWGLVVNEAFNVGIPCILSENVGAVDTIAFDKVNCRIIDSLDEIKSIHNQMKTTNEYELLRNRIKKNFSQNSLNHHYLSSFK